MRKRDVPYCNGQQVVIVNQGPLSGKIGYVRGITYDEVVRSYIVQVGDNVDTWLAYDYKYSCIVLPESSLELQ